MKPIKLSLLGLLLIPAALWLLADTLAPQPFTYFSFRTVFVQFSGIIAIAAMSAALVLATRPKRIEPWLDGLDKMYRLHKWLGIAALASATLHWWFAKGTKWMVGWGWLERPARRGGAGPALEGIEGWLRGQRHLAETLGEWAFYAVAVLIVLALVRRFPYHLFAKTHRWLALGYLVLAWHALVLAKFGYWSQPIGWLLAVLLAAGGAAALQSLLRRIGANRKVGGVIEALTWYPAVQALETEVRLDPGWPGHAAGQFAFVTSHGAEGAHPYTIASDWHPDERRIRFITKALGDHTSALPGQLREGDRVTVEGPYGCFDFSGPHARQIWVGAGIGITPFVARMKQLAHERGLQRIDLFHPTSELDPAAMVKLEQDARAANIRLHVIPGGCGQRLTGERIRKLVPGWRESSVWFCGPAEFGAQLRADLVGAGLPARDFHEELFRMR